jgi:hypothetical protein
VRVFFDWVGMNKKIKNKVLHFFLYILILSKKKSVICLDTRYFEKELREGIIKEEPIKALLLHRLLIKHTQI